MIRREPFEYEIHENAGVTEFTFSGALDEHAKFPEVRPTMKAVIRVGGITVLNSQGTRMWIGWLTRFRPPIEVSLEECPILFVKNFSLVKGFLPEHFHVRSFFVPYYSEATRERRDVLLEEGVHYGRGVRMTLPQQLDSAGMPMEVDVVESTYFKFLKQRI